MERAAEDWIRDGREYCRTLLLRGNRICAPAVIARRQTLRDVGGFDADLGFACDYEMWMKVCMHGRVAFLHQPLVRYRWHGRNASHAYRFEHGVEEMQTAGHRALQYYQQRTGAHDEGQLLGEAMAEITRARWWAAQVERGRVWLEEQRANWEKIAEERERMIEQQRVWIASLEGSKVWLEEQQQNWRRAVEEWEQMMREQQARIAEQQAWIAELEKAKNWLEEQRANWQGIAEERERLIGEQRAWIGELETSKNRLEGEWRAWRESAWGRLGTRIGMVKPSVPSAPEANSETQR
jgi:hypothetical protein